MLAKGCAKFSEILNKASKNYPRSFDFSQSGEIPSILVTLAALVLMIFLNHSLDRNFISMKNF